MPASVRSIVLPGPTGQIEGLWKNPGGTGRGVAVVAHAHPLHGGTMHFKVVFRLARALARAGYGVLRFNFRGVGASEGVHDGGRGERDDFRAALDEAVRRGGVPAIAAGFSFGSVIALSVGTEDARVDAMIGAGVPLDRWKFGGLECVEKPALLVSGSRDVFGDAALLRREAASRFRDARVEVVDGADHFFTGHLDELESLAFEFSSARSVEAVR